jgi:peptide/nickel transport system substrate-binding protein
MTESVAPGALPKGGALNQRLYSRREMVRFFAFGGAGLGAAPILGRSMGLLGRTTGLRDFASNTKAATGWEKPPVSFVYLDTTEPDSLDASQTNEFDAFLITNNTYDALTLTDETSQKLVPWLATSWKANPDITEWTFTLRPGVKFIDGSSMDEAAVVVSMQRHLAIGSIAEAGYMLKGITSVKATGPMQVTFITDAPQPWLPYHMVMFPIISKQAIEDHRTSKDPWAMAYFQDHCVGTGPYKLSSWVKGTKITLAKNDEWWAQPWAPGSIDNVTVSWESDPSTTVELIAKGAANFSTEMSLSNALSFADKPGFTLKQYRANTIDPMLTFNQAKPPFDKVEVRQAFQYAFDYDAMREYFHGYAKPTSGVLPSWNPYVLNSLPIYKQDLVKAKALLSSAGVDPASITATCYTAAGYADLVAGGTILQASLAQIGVHIQLQSLQFGAILSAMDNIRSAPALASAWYNGDFSLDPTSYFSELLPTGPAFTSTRWDSPSFAAAYNNASAATSEAGIRAGLDKCQQIIHEDAPVIFGALPEMIIPVPNYLEGYVMQATNAQYPVRFWQLRLREH